MLNKLLQKISIIAFASLPLTTYALRIGGNTDPTAEHFLVRLINTALEFSMALAVLFIIIGGVQYIVSRGNEDKIKVAKKTLTYAIIGFIIVLVSLTIVNFVQDALVNKFVK